MSAPRRLLEDGSDFERGVLSSARIDQGSDRGLTRTLAAIGVGAAATTAGATAGATVGAAGALGTKAAVTAAMAMTPRVGVWVLAKWIGVGVLASAATVGGIHHAARLRAARLAESSTSVPVQRKSSVLAQAPLVANAVAGDPNPDVIQTSEPPAPAPATPAPEADLASSLLGPSSNAAATAASTPSARTPEVHTSRHAVKTTSGKRFSARPSSEIPLAPAPSPAATTPTSPAAEAPATPPPPALPAEVRMLEEVRSALRANDPEKARRDLDHYDQAFPGGSLRDEAAVLRVDVLVAQGDRIGAAALARRFLTAHPNSPHAPGLERALGRLSK
jgi:hypothetical protein